MSILYVYILGSLENASYNVGFKKKKKKKKKPFVNHVNDI